MTDAVHVTGRFDYQLRVACRDTAELDRLLRHLKRDGGVSETDTRVVLRSAFTRGALRRLGASAPRVDRRAPSPPSSTRSATSSRTSRAVNWLALLLGMAIFIGYLSLRARASFNILRAAYPEERIEFRSIWGAYLAGYGFNSVVPARGGDVVRLFLTKTSVPNSSYPAVGSSFFVEQIFDLSIAIPILLFAFTQGAFPKPPDFSKLPAFDLAFFASHPRFTLFLLTALAIAALAAFALLSARVRAFWRACARA